MTHFSIRLKAKQRKWRTLDKRIESRLRAHLGIDSGYNPKYLITGLNCAPIESEYNPKYFITGLTCAPRDDWSHLVCSNLEPILPRQVVQSFPVHIMKSLVLCGKAQQPLVFQRISKTTPAFPNTVREEMSFVLDQWRHCNHNTMLCLFWT